MQLNAARASEPAQAAAIGAGQPVPGLLSLGVELLAPRQGQPAPGLRIDFPGLGHRRAMVADKQLGQPLAALAIGLVETPGARAVEVEHPNHFAILDQRHHQLRARIRIASDMARKFMHIPDQHGLAARRRGAAHALADRDAQAGGLALERPEHQHLALAEIEPGPIEVGQALIDQRRHVRGVGDPIGFAVEQRRQFYGEVMVKLWFDVAHADFRPAGARLAIS